ncbi:MAG: hypothetical protein KDD34_03190, partial [Bdellovibrionales bacterium]|nr:hypothetical protein [Bdellovibrionales bacterium]
MFTYLCLINFNLNFINKLSQTASITALLPLVLSFYKLFYSKITGKPQFEGLFSLGYFSGYFGNQNIFSQFAMLISFFALFSITTSKKHSTLY